MENVRRENLEMKIPALLHLSRLGYEYLSRKQLRRRDRKTNILPDAVRAAAERINGIPVPEETFARLMEDLQSQLDADDLGSAFYRTLRNGWRGLRLIDFEHPENNRFQSAAEMACGSGAGSFRPDITLMINGFPLAMIEMKTRDHARSLQAEYDRMAERFRNKEMRRFLQCTQIWAFSDDHADDPGRLLPVEGSYFATVMTEAFPLYAVRDRRARTERLPRARNPEEEQRILEDNGIQAKPSAGGFRRSLSPGKPAHRMLTTLFRPERFLFLLRYGIQYVQDAESAGKRRMIRRMLTAEQLAMLEALVRKAKRGYRNWSAPFCGAAGTDAANASMIALVQDLAPGAELYWVSNDETELQRDRGALESCGVSSAQGEDATEAQVTLMTADKEPEESGGRKIFILPQMIRAYGQKTDFRARLRRRFPDAILITRTTRQQETTVNVPLCLENLVERNRSAVLAEIRNW